MAALVASKLPVNEASAVMERLTGVKLPPATLDREARRQGRRAEEKRLQLDEEMRTAQGAEQMLPAARAAPSPWSSNWTLGISANGTPGVRARPCAATAAGVTGTLALGLWRHVFSFGSTGGKRWGPSPQF